MKKTHHISPDKRRARFSPFGTDEDSFPCGRKGEWSGGQAQCFAFLPMRSRRSVVLENFGFWYAAHCRMLGTFGKEFGLVMC